MAVKRFKETPSKFKFNDIIVGLRLPSVEEMKQITKRRKDYLLTVRADVISDKRDDIADKFNPDGDASLLVEIEREVSALLCCDPDDAGIPWFAKNAEEQKQLDKQGIAKDTPDDVPASFHHIAFQVFTVATASAKPVDFTKETDDEDEDKAPLDANATTESSTTTSSVDSASKSQSGSVELIPSASSGSGDTTSS